MITRTAAIGLALVVAMIGAGTAGAATSDATAAAEPFPLYESIRGNVDFWVRVFSEWRLDQLAVHDQEDPTVVYEVVDLPGLSRDRYSEAQRDWIAATVERWELRLADLEARVAGGQPLTDEQTRWAAGLKRAGVAAASRRVRVQRGQRERFRRGVEVSSRYDSAFRQIFRRHGLPEDLAYLPHVESSFQISARSHAGAVGAWQFTRGTGRQYLKIGAALDERLDPVAAADAAARYLADAHARLGDWALSLTAYNHGIAGMRRAAEQHGGNYEQVFREYEGRRFGFASKNFYAEFLAARRIADDPERYFPEGIRPEPELNLDFVALDRRVTPRGLAEVYRLPLPRLSAINPAWTSRAVASNLPLPQGTRAWLPAGHLDDLKRRGIRPDLAAAAHDSTYAVRRGDTLSKIARNHGMSLTRLRNLNGLSSAEQLIRVGQRLRVTAPGLAEFHVVRRGDTLIGIAVANGMTLDELRSINNLGPGHELIRAGQRLRVSSPEATRVHIVRRGESLLRIALAYRVRLGDLLQRNRLSERSVIHPGQRIRIP